jgi:hypothetical protein
MREGNGSHWLAAVPWHAALSQTLHRCIWWHHMHLVCHEVSLWRPDHSLEPAPMGASATMKGSYRLTSYSLVTRSTVYCGDSRSGV